MLTFAVITLSVLIVFITNKLVIKRINNQAKSTFESEMNRLEKEGQSFRRYDEVTKEWLKSRDNNLN